MMRLLRDTSDIRARRLSRLMSTALAGSLAGLLASAAPVLGADNVSGSASGGYGRMMFSLDGGAAPRVSLTGSVLVLTFPQKTSLKPAQIAAMLPGYVAGVRADPDGMTFRVALKQPVRLQTSSAGGKTAVDLIPSGFSGNPAPLRSPPQKKSGPAKPVDMANLTPLKVRSGAYQNFTRVVFDWPGDVPYSVAAAPGRLQVRFGAAVKPDLSALERQLPPWVKPAGWHIDGQSTVVDFTTDSDSGYHDFRDGSHVVIDVLAPKTDAGAYQPPGAAHPKVSPLRGDGKAPGVSLAQSEEVLKAAGKLNNPPPPPPQVTASDGKPNIAPAGKNIVVDGKASRDSVWLDFPGSAGRSAAVFARGNTAWVVLQGSQPFDITKIKKLQGSSVESVDTVAAAGVSVLRLILKNPQRIAAYADNGSMKVVIGPQASGNPQNVAFTRSQDDAARTALTATLDGAAKSVTLNDPGAKDKLVAIPGTLGEAVVSGREFVDFSLLPTAAGVVVEPFVDDVTINVSSPRVEITRRGGLSLSQNGAMGTVQPFQPAAATESSFLDYAHWGRMTGGSFLATERNLRNEGLHQNGLKANQARLNLAKFYLANDFGAEALGLLNNMQANGSTGEDDNQLKIMKAAANYQMGRYREAHNVLADSAFDTDRHAALWRGLIDTALENYESAAANFERAAPVLDRYRSDVQAKARLAAAEAALALGHRDEAKKQIDHLPADMPDTLRPRADLIRARYYAQYDDKRTANQLFAAAERSGDPRVVAEAIFYRIDSGLQNGQVTPEQAINALERLRYRWRGDSLEMKVLNRLATLYFKQKKWREGLGDLRVAAKYFPNSDASAHAQEQMRALYSDLFLHGGADNMPPTDALGLFYDFIDLTPIGPDGDEMIRRMSDRLTAVDLMGPASDLLQYQVNKRLDGMARAQVAARLAAVQLMDHKPQAALDTLLTTQIAAMPDDVIHQRLLVQARALADLKRWDEALDLIALDNSPDTQRFRADIYWRSGNWGIAAQKAEQSLGNRWNDAPTLSDEERQTVMRAAVAYALAGDENSLNRVRARYTVKMNASSDAKAFGIVTQRTDMRGLAFREAAAKVASVDALKEFMKDLEKKK